MKLFKKVILRFKYFQYKINQKKISLPLDFPFKKVILNGEFIHIEPSFRVLGNGNVGIDNNCIIAEKFTAITTLHQIRDDGEIPYSSENDIVKDIKIEQNVWVGANVTVFGGVTIGEGSVIGANSLVIKNVPPRAIIGGSPARVIRYRDENIYETQMSEKKLYLPLKYSKVGHV